MKFLWLPEWNEALKYRDQSRLTISRSLFQLVLVTLALTLGSPGYKHLCLEKEDKSVLRRYQNYMTHINLLPLQRFQRLEQLMKLKKYQLESLKTHLRCFNFSKLPCGACPLIPLGRKQLGRFQFLLLGKYQLESSSFYTQTMLIFLKKNLTKNVASILEFLKLKFFGG